MTKPKLSTNNFSPWPHRWAVVLCCATFPLIWVGGLVTTYDAGMAVPDWPSTYGYNLFLYPWTTWLFGPFDLLVEASAILAQILGGGLGVGIFVFTMLAWGNALEVRGNMIEWKHIMLVLVMALLVVTWTGILAFPITVGGSFGFIAYIWYASK